MKIAVSTSLISPYTCTEPVTRRAAIERLCAGGLRYLDYNLAPEFQGTGGQAGESPLVTKAWRGWCDEIREACAEHGAQFLHTHCLTHNYFAADEASQRLNGWLARAFEATALLGARLTVMHPIAPPGREYDRAACLAANRDFFRRQAETAARFGIRIAVENMLSNRLFDGGIYKRYCTGSDELMELVEAVDCENVGVCVDVGHSHYMGEAPETCIARCAPRLWMLHLHDNDGFNDSHVPPYCGSMDWPSVYRALRTIGYNGCAMLEIQHACERLPAQMQLETVRYVARLAQWMAQQIGGTEYDQA